MPLGHRLHGIADGPDHDPWTKACARDFGPPRALPWSSFLRALRHRAFHAYHRPIKTDFMIAESSKISIVRKNRIYFLRTCGKLLSE
jgi:hypothetical protein